MRDVEQPAIAPTRQNGSPSRQHLPGPASGWAATARFGPGGTCWAGSGPCLRVIAVNPQRGTGSSPDARLDLLRRAVEQPAEDGPHVYLTSAGFFGSAAPAGDRIAGLYWPGDLDLGSLDSRLGDLASRLPRDTIIGVGVEQSSAYADQRIWWYSGVTRTRDRETVRTESPMAERRIEVGGFRLLAFVCGELCDGGSGFDPETDTAGIDVVLDAAHASVARAWDREATPPEVRIPANLPRPWPALWRHARADPRSGFRRRLRPTPRQLGSLQG